jgi:hypothetical protein
MRLGRGFLNKKRDVVRVEKLKINGIICEKQAKNAVYTEGSLLV